MGIPVPWFLADQDHKGSWDFRVVLAPRALLSVTRKLCWVCGQPYATRATVITGPAGMVTRAVVDPPMHPACATFAVKVCPFMVNPDKERRLPKQPNDVTPGIALDHNPGVCFTWTDDADSIVPIPGGNGEAALITMRGRQPTLDAWANGRAATGAELNQGFRLAAAKLIRIAMNQGTQAMSDLGAGLIDTIMLIRAQLPMVSQEGLSWGQAFTEAAEEVAREIQRRNMERDIRNAVAKEMLS